MSIIFLNRHPLEDHISGIKERENPNHLSVLRGPTVFSVLAHKGYQASVRASLSSLAETGLRICGPDEFLVVSETIGADRLARDLAALGPGLSFVDQSDGRIVFRLSGPNVRRILAKCVAVDLDPGVFAQGQSANLLCCHVSANLARVGADTFEIAVMRSFCGTVFEEIMEMGREFALTAGFSS